MQHPRFARCAFSMSRSLALMAGLATIALSACGPRTGPVDLTKSIEKPGKFQSVLSEHTRNGQIWEWSYRHANVHATLVTPRLRSAFIQDRRSYFGTAAQRVADDMVRYGAPPDEGMDAPLAKTPVSESEVVVYVSLYTPDNTFRYLGGNDTPWTIALHRGDERVLPKKVEARDIDESLTGIFPYVDRFDRFYVVRFPRQTADGTPLMMPGAEPLKLSLGSTLGEVNVAWTLLGPGGKAEALDTAPTQPLPDRALPPAAPASSDAASSDAASSDAASSEAASAEVAESSADASEAND